MARVAAMRRRSRGCQRPGRRAPHARATLVVRRLASHRCESNFPATIVGIPCADAALLMTCSYVLPMRLSAPADDELVAYLRWLGARLEVIVVDGSTDGIFADHAARFGDRIIHLAPDADVRHFANGKVAGVVTGVRRASHESIVIADDDVRYDEQALAQMVAALACADVVRPQNYFDPVPWHAGLDTARTLLNRISGGDWPGTLGVRRSRLVATNGYDGDVMFENLELVRTVTAAGGVEAGPHRSDGPLHPPTL